MHQTRDEFVQPSLPFTQIAGAAAERGQSLEEVTALAQRVADSIGKWLSILPAVQHCSSLLPTATMSVSLSPCSVPGLKPSFTLEKDEMELGLGKLGMSLRLHS